MPYMKSVKVYKSGNSLVAGLPADLCRMMDIKEGTEMTLIPNFNTNTIAFVKKAPASHRL